MAAVWREGAKRDVTLRPGPLGVQISRLAAADAIREVRAGDALVRGGRGRTWQPLPETRREVEGLAGMFPAPVTLFGPDASEPKLEELARSGRLKEFDVVHLATHGIADAAVPMRSALILTEEGLPDAAEEVLAGRPAYTGRLTADRILRTWTLEADLVTLSACESGLGREAGGEGYVGFAQALFLAGARSVVLSLWKVDDRATALLMTRFYSNVLGMRVGLTGPLPKAVALAEAKPGCAGAARRNGSPGGRPLATCATPSALTGPASSWRATPVT
jgi:CHAT domain-containing protein